MRHFPLTAILSPALFFLLVLSGCVGRAPEGGIPLPRAYPRIAIADSVFRPLCDLPLLWEANEWAIQSNKKEARGSVMTDLVYTPYNGVLLLTFSNAPTHADRIRIISNRRERINLNTGNLYSRSVGLETERGISAEIITIPSGSPVPVQFIADAGHWIVSGSFLLDHAPASADSIKPVVNAVTRDIIHALKNLR